MPDQTVIVPTQGAPSTSISEVLAARGRRYGDFKTHAQITQDLKKVMQKTKQWSGLSADKKEALEMLAHKIGRVLNGDPEYEDSWRDMEGYSRLVADDLVGEHG
jgi:hypothetical protein